MNGSSSLWNLARKLDCFREISLLKTLFWNLRAGHRSLPLLLYPNVHFRMGRKAKIIHNGGRLKVGGHWDLSRYMPSEMKICDDAVLEINGNMQILTGCSINICPGAKLSIGRGGINVGGRIVCFQSITIGDNTWLGDHVIIRDNDNHLILGNRKPSASPIRIGNNVWFGINVTVLKGVTVGDGAVVAANSLVIRDVPPGALVGGSPARILKENIKWEM